MSLNSSSDCSDLFAFEPEPATFRQISSAGVHRADLLPHSDAEELAHLLPSIRSYQKLATRHGIQDVFQDNGGKVLQVCLLLGLSVIAGREGNDARDDHGVEYELKTLNLSRSDAFTTHHHLNPTIISKYRQVDWIFATYRDIELQEIYRLGPAEMECWFSKWEEKWNRDGGKDINNPKVPSSYVRQHGKLVYPRMVIN